LVHADNTEDELALKQHISNYWIRSLSCKSVS